MENPHITKIKQRIMNFVSSKSHNKFNCIFIFLCEENQIDLLNWVKEEYPTLTNDAFKHRNYIAFNLTCEKGHLEILNWLKSSYPDQLKDAFKGSNNKYNGFNRACECNQLNVLKWMKEQFPDMMVNALSTLNALTSM